MPDQLLETEEKFRFKYRAIFFESSEMYFNRTTMETAYRPLIWRPTVFGEGFNSYQPTPARIKRLLKLANNPFSQVIVEVLKINDDNVLLVFSSISVGFKDKGEYYEFLANSCRNAAIANAMIAESKVETQ